MFPNKHTWLTVGEHPRGGELDVWQRSEMVEHGAPVALFLGIIHKGPYIMLLAVVTDPRADHHGDVICDKTETDEL